MPHTINGIGTWYYGKRRIHTVKDACEFCGKLTSLESYDTTLYFVVVMVPIIPLGQKRILQQCASCQRHRVVNLAQWEAGKALRCEQVLEKLKNDPEDREAITEAINVAVGYQDEPLFDSIVERLAGDRATDAQIQMTLGNGYAYFARWPLAEECYRAALAVEDTDNVREQLAWALLKQDRPDEARPYLEHVLSQKKADMAGSIYYLVKGYQAQGRHEEALELMDERDEAFPQWVNLKEYQVQRKTSVRYRNSGKKVASSFLTQGKTGYREGNWTSRAPRWIALLVVVAILGVYIGSAIWIGQSQRVFLVNGTNEQYAVVVQGTEYVLPRSSVTTIHIAEGEVPVGFPDTKLKLEPFQTRIETNFWGRPFRDRAFIINPDQSAIVMEEEAYYAKANPPQPGPPTVHFGRDFYNLPGADYEFVDFPANLTVKGQTQVRKTRVGLMPVAAQEFRLRMLEGLEQSEQIKICRKLLQLDPYATVFLHWLSARLPQQEMMEFLETRLNDVPILVEWHRVFQTLMERTQPQTDLRPRYRQLLADNAGNPDALYLLGRVEPDLDESEKIYRQAAAKKPPSGYALSGIGYRALSEGKFGEAKTWFEKASPVLRDKTVNEQFHREALLANGDYDLLQEKLQREAMQPGIGLAATIQLIRVYAIRGDKINAQQKITEAMGLVSFAEQGQTKKTLEAIVCCCQKDVAGYLTRANALGSFEANFLRGEYQKAGNQPPSQSEDLIDFHGLMYLAGVRTGSKELTDVHWTALLAELNKGARDERRFGELLSGQKQLTKGLAQKLPIQPTNKRVLLAVLAQRHPEQADELLKLAKRLNYQRDAVSLCLSKFLERR
jgi:tetratricopeptide (TPR) repeat protein